MGRTTHAGGLTPQEAAEGSSMLGSVVRTGVSGAVTFGILGFLVGGVMNIRADIGKDLGEATSHPCFDKNCARSGAAIGAAAGFVLGAALGAVSAKPSPSSGQANVSMVRLRNGKLGVGASVKF